MAFSMHSHSGQFCPGHAQDDLEEVILAAIARGMKTFAFTEHMPRESVEDLYPEEIAAGDDTSSHIPRHSLFLLEATRLRTKYASQIHILIGFEGEWIRPSYGPFITSFASSPVVDFFIGSVHHVHGLPIDYDKKFYSEAVARSGSEEQLFVDYFDLQYEMLGELKPRVVGHFDLIRLLASEPDAELESMGSGIVWEKVLRNLQRVKEQGGLLEVNSAGLRKGLREPYPGKKICEVWKGMGGRFTLSDDSHGVVQVGTNYLRMFEFLSDLGVEEVWTFESKEGENGGKRELMYKMVGMDEVRASFKE
ncbi:hypothetical protein HYALB_00007696 [Hymenoscyphus albidus]|uniref:Histidinol-phosphatase n=1 Tax=Hymenoscyphus albidus TaxID=595503 RepID=A0A9N9LJL8_9HELO|nr:hypothetical protein HYALB_00007696 [Hymenoscyphus albidus]